MAFSVTVGQGIIKVSEDYNLSLTYQVLGQIDKKGWTNKKKVLWWTCSEKYIDKGYDKLIAFSREFVVGANEEKSNLLLPFE